MQDAAHDAHLLTRMLATLVQDFLDGYRGVPPGRSKGTANLDHAEVFLMFLQSTCGVAPFCLRNGEVYPLGQSLSGQSDS
jgi:hypothetical protein